MTSALSSPSMTNLDLRFDGSTVEYWIGQGCSDEIADALTGLNPDVVLIVTDDTVRDIAGDLIASIERRLPVVVLSDRAGEERKSLSVVEQHLYQAIESGATKQSIVLALGGGVPGNVGGLLAGLLFRGVRLVHVPTNLASATDSVISFKQAVNTPFGKNQIGLFRVPTAIFCDLELLGTLSPKEIRAGLCEAIKNALAISPDQIPSFANHLLDRAFTPDQESLRWMLESCVDAKLRVMRDDPYETGEALVLEYGHTIGHALELREQELRGSLGLSHGECVGFGLVAAALISHRMGFLNQSDVELHRSFVGRIGAPHRLPTDVTVESILALVRRDNKRGYIPSRPDEVPMVILERLGRPLTTFEYPLVAVPIHVLREVLVDLVSPIGAP